MGNRTTGTTGFMHQFVTGRPHLVELTEILNQPEGIGYTMSWDVMVDDLI